MLNLYRLQVLSQSFKSSEYNEYLPTHDPQDEKGVN